MKKKTVSPFVFVTQVKTRLLEDPPSNFSLKLIVQIDGTCMYIFAPVIKKERRNYDRSKLYLNSMGVESTKMSTININQYISETKKFKCRGILFHA